MPDNINLLKYSVNNNYLKSIGYFKTMAYSLGLFCSPYLSVGFRKRKIKSHTYTGARMEHIKTINILDGFLLFLF